MHQKIGIDIDGVLTKEGKKENNIWLQKIREHIGEPIKRKKEVYDFKEAFNLTTQQVENFINKNIEEIYINIPPAPGAKEVLDKFKEKNLTIILITARQDKYNKLTKKWLNKYNFTYDSLYHREKKAPLAKQLGIELFIEDHKQNTKELLRAGIPVIVVDKYHNRNISSSMVNRAKNWAEIEKIVNNYFNL